MPPAVRAGARTGPAGTRAYYACTEAVPWSIVETLGRGSHAVTRVEQVSDEILRVAELAQLLKVADKTVYSMAQRGELPAFKVGGQWRFRRTDIATWIDAQTQSRSSKKRGLNGTG